MVLPVNKGDSCPEDKVCSIGSPFLSPRFLAFFVDPFCEAQTSGVFLPVPSLSFPVFLSFLFAKTISRCLSSLSKSRVIQQPLAWVPALVSLPFSQAALALGCPGSEEGSGLVCGGQRALRAWAAAT